MRPLEQVACAARSWRSGLIRRGGLASWFGVGIAPFGAPVALIGVVPEQAAAIVLLGLVGIGNALIDVGGFTMLARLADETVLARMFAGFEGSSRSGSRPAACWRRWSSSCSAFASRSSRS